MAIQASYITKLIASPLLCAALLAGVAIERRARVTPANVEPYHKWAQSCIGLQTDNGTTVAGKTTTPAIEGTISHFVDQYRNGKLIGQWIGKDEPIPTAAQQLLKPNGILSRTYSFDPAADFHEDFGQASVLIIQCRDSRDMLGHYPPKCYPAHGDTQTGEKPREWLVGDLLIPGMAYSFTRHFKDKQYTRVVYNFLIVPGQGLVPDMETLREASEYYERRAYGAAQFQVVMPDRVDEATRDEIFRALITPNINLIRELANPQRVSS